MGLVLSLILMFSYYLLFIGGTRIAGNAQLSPFLGAWFPNLVFLVIGGVLILRSDRERENQGLQFLVHSVDWLKNRATAIWSQTSRLTRWAYSLTRRSKVFRLIDLYVLRGFWFYFFLVLVVFVSLFIIVTLFEIGRAHV